MRHKTTLSTLTAALALAACGGEAPDPRAGLAPAPSDEQTPAPGEAPPDAPLPIDDEATPDPSDQMDDRDEPDLSAFIAPFDNDALQNPAVSEFLSITGNRELVYFDQISALEGDEADWVEFELPNASNSAQRIQVELTCELSGQASEQIQARVTLWEDGEEDTTLRALCNDGVRELTVDNTRVQSARVHFAVPPVDSQVLVDYELRVLAFR